MTLMQVGFKLVAITTEISLRFIMMGGACEDIMVGGACEDL